MRDGFCRCCDGFGGGSAKEKILEIMKDSRVRIVWNYWDDLNAWYKIFRIISD